jgi:hypothetical protein
MHGGNFRDLRKAEVQLREPFLPRTPVNKGNKMKGRGGYAQPSLEVTPIY